MFTLLKISWRNIWRNKKRSLVIITAITLGLVGGNFISSAYIGMMNQTMVETIEKQLSHIQIHHPDFIAEREIRHDIENAGAIVNDLRSHPKIKAVAARTKTDGMVASPYLSAGISIVGVVAQKEIETTGFDQQIIKGSYFKEAGRFPSTVIGQELAEKLQSDIGSRIVLTFQDAEREMVSASFRVEGIFRSAATEYEKRVLFVQAEDFNALIGKEDPTTEIAIRLHDKERTEAVTKELSETYPGLSVRSWKEMAPELEFLMDWTIMSLMWIIGIILLGVSFGILNTILMSVMERTRELGMLMSVGMKKSLVFGMVVLETVMLSLTGGLMGMVLSLGLVSYLNKQGMDLSVIGGEALRDFGFSPVIYPELHAGFYFQVTVMIVVFAILAAIYPARKAIKLQPAEAVRKE